MKQIKPIETTIDIDKLLLILGTVTLHIAPQFYHTQQLDEKIEILEMSIELVIIVDERE